MTLTHNISTTFLILTLIVVLLPVETYAFGAGDIPDFAYLNDKAFRHGDIENILETLVKSAGGAAAGGGLLGFAQSVINQATGGAKFSKSDIKKVYFGNWLRDYSQAMDIAGLSKLTADTLVLVVSILGFMTFGFATEEFQVTPDRLGVYLPVEHIDNPKGYAAKEGDARQFHPRLRPPVDDRELEIDHRTGMKNYMATENEGWDTSTAFIRRTFHACIEAGRRSGGAQGADLWEAYRLLGTGLHTMEDLLAHSNWCEVALRKMGHEEVFCHVGDNVIVDTPHGPAPPLITGTFGGADFIYSLMGEATDKLSQASVTDLTDKMNQASQGGGNISALKDILSKLPIGGSSDETMDQGEEMHAQSQAYHFDPDNVAPPEVQQQLITLLKWRDDVYRDVLAKIEMVPGLSDLIDELTNALNAYVYTVLSPYIVPILQQATGYLGEGSKAVIDSEDQYEVFDNPDASDPSHSFLSKDHFDLILNEPAGKIAQLVVQHSVNLIVPAWADDSDADQVIDQILEAFHHPYYASGNSTIQRDMFDYMERWIGGLGSEEADTTLQLLTKDNVRNGKNKRPGSENESHTEIGYGGHSHSHGNTYNQGGQHSSRTEASYGRNDTYSNANQRQTYGGDESYGRSQGAHGTRRSDNAHEQTAYGEEIRNPNYGVQGRGSYSSHDEDSSNRNQSSRHAYGESGEGGHRRSRNEYETGHDADDPSRRSGYDRETRQEGYGAGGQRAGAGESRAYRQHDEQESSGYVPAYGRKEVSGGDYGDSTYSGRAQPEQSEYERGAEETSYDYSRQRDGYKSSGYGRDESSYSTSDRHDDSHHHRRGNEESTNGAYNDQGESRISSGYGRTEDSSYGSSTRERDDYNPSVYGNQTTYNSGYVPTYRGDNEDTFGVDQLNIRSGDGEDEDEGSHRHHGHGHHGRRNRSNERNDSD